MMNKLNKVLIGLLALQVLILLLVFYPGGRGGNEAAGPLFPDLRPETAERITVYSENDKKVELVKEEGQWTVPEEKGYPADAEKVEGILKKIAEIETDSLISTEKASHKRLKVSEDEYNRLVEIATSGGENPYRLFLGSSPVYRKVYVRSASGEEVYQTGGLAAWELPTEPASWLDHKYLNLQEDAVKAVEIVNKSGKISLLKDDSGAWSLEGLEKGMQIKQDEWKKLLKKALYIRMDKPLGSREESKWGLESPGLTLRIKITESGDGQGDTDLTVVFGKKDEQNNAYPAKSSKSRFFVSVPAYSVSDLMEAEKSGLVEKKTGGD